MAPLINFITPLGPVRSTSFSTPLETSATNRKKWQVQLRYRCSARMISTGSATPDVLVIGGGVIGLSSALELAYNGANVCVLTRDVEESATRNAAGMLGRNSERLVSGPLSKLAKRSRALYPHFIAKLDRPVSHVSRDDFLVPYLSHEEIEEEEVQHQLLAANGDDSSSSSNSPLITGSVLRDIEPALGKQVVGARRILGDSHLDNRQLLRSLYATCEAHDNIEIISGVDIRHLQCNTTTTTSSGTTTGEIDYAVAATGEIYRAGHYLVAAGAWTNKLLPHLPIRPIKGQMMSLAGSGGVIDDDTTLLRLPSHVLHAKDIYVVPKRHLGLYFIGATVEDNGSLRRNTTAHAALQLLEAAVKIVPAFAHCEIREHWAGLRPATPDLMPIVGKDRNYNNLSVASGTYRNGVLFAPAVATLAAAAVAGKEDIMLDAEMKALLDAFSIERFYAKNYCYSYNQNSSNSNNTSYQTSTKQSMKAAAPVLSTPQIPTQQRGKVDRALVEQNLIKEAMKESISGKRPSFFASTTTAQNGALGKNNNNRSLSRREIEADLMRQATGPPSSSFVTGSPNPDENGVSNNNNALPKNDASNTRSATTTTSQGAAHVFRTRADGVREAVEPSARYLKRMSRRNSDLTTTTTTAISTIPTIAAPPSNTDMDIGTSNNAYDDVLQHRGQAEAKLREGLRASRNFVADPDADPPVSSTAPVSYNNNNNTSPAPHGSSKNTTTTIMAMGTSNNAYDDVLQHRDQAEAKLREGLRANRNFTELDE